MCTICNERSRTLSLPVDVATLYTLLTEINDVLRFHMILCHATRRLVQATHVVIPLQTIYVSMPYGMAENGAAIGDFLRQSDEFGKSVSACSLRALPSV